MVLEIYRLFSGKIEAAIEMLVAHFFGAAIRRRSIQAVRAYVQGVKYARTGVFAIFGLGLLAALMISGVVLMVIGIVELLPLTPIAMALSYLAMGFLMAFISLTIVIHFFREKRWLAVSRSFELIDAVLEPWPGALPPNPLEVIKKSVAVKYLDPKPSKSPDATT